MKYFVLMLCVLFCGVLSKTALKRNDSDKDGKNSPLIWFMIQQLNALGARVEKLRDIAHESQKDMISMKRDMADLKSRNGKFAIDKNEQSLDDINSKVIAVANKKKIDNLTSKIDKFDTVANKKKFDRLEARLDKFDNSKLDKQIKQALSQIKRFSDNYDNIGGGDTYVRWGRSTCPSKNGTTLVYSGFSGGGYYAAVGAPAEPVCLPTDPNFLKTSGTNSAFIYGMEFQSKFFGSDALNQDVPCSVCHVQIGTTIMIPGKTTCNKGWKLEYAGNLGAGYYGHAAASTYLCVDLNPEYLHHGSHDYIGKLLYEVVGQCGSLPCPPYRHGYPLTCAVCSK
ncbi:uncharacterized protein [Mytilus edulis]|uniref:uncharacterized protein n=1 Tax=Mytilus edulis TaxID=6550 RepID=UPI0039EDF0AE